MNALENELIQIIMIYTLSTNKWEVLENTFLKCAVFVLAAGYFTDCISEQDLDEMNIEIIRNMLYRVCISY